MNKVKLKDICKIEKGKIGISKATPGKYPLVVTAEERASHNEFHFIGPSVIVPLVSSTGHGHASIKRIHYQEDKFAVGNILAVLTPIDQKRLNAKYLYIYLSANKDNLLVSRMRGAANVSLSISALEDVIIELPDYETQLKIIELYTRNKEFENQLLDGISERGKLIENLRQQILQDAITGKLSEKWRKENKKVESVKVLLEKIVKEKEELIKQKKLKKEKPLKPLQDAEVPFEIPKTWAWCKLGNIGNSNIGLTYNPSNISEKGQPVLRANNIKEGKINTSNVIYVQATVPENKILNKGDIVLCARSGSKDLVGKAAVVEVDGYSFGAFMTCFKSILNPYIYFFFQSNLYKSQIDDRKATGINQLTQDLLRNLLIPIPPLQEQQLIISKLKKIFDNIDKLCEFTKVQNTSVSQIYRTVLKDNFNITFESAA